REERALLTSNRDFHLLFRSQRLREPLTELWIVLVQYVLRPCVVPNRRCKLLGYKLQVSQGLVGQGELDVRVAELIQGVDDGEVGEVVEFIYRDSERCLIAVSP